MNHISVITFNVIFLPRTVRYLAPFVHSLVNRTSSPKFRLVSNCCLPEEKRTLRDLCAQDEQRLSFLDLSYTKTQPHGFVLNELQQREQSAIFAFMDSDCFATGDFSKHLISELPDADAVFSGRPIWSDRMVHRLGKGFKLLHCPYDELHDGQCTGNSYFAVYDNEVLSKCMEETKVSFSSYRWRRIPEPIQQELEYAGKRLESYDTGKLLNILMGLRGYRCKCVNLPSLWHLGGISSSERNRIRLRLRQLPGALGTTRLLRRILQKTGLREDGACGICADEQKQIFLKVERKTRVSDHMLTLLRALEKQSPVVKPFLDDDESLVASVARAESYIRDIYAEWFESMSMPPDEGDSH